MQEYVERLPQPDFYKESWRLSCPACGLKVKGLPDMDIWSQLPLFSGAALARADAFGRPKKSFETFRTPPTPSGRLRPLPELSWQGDWLAEWPCRMEHKRHTAEGGGRDCCWQPRRAHAEPARLARARAAGWLTDQSSTIRVAAKG